MEFRDPVEKYADNEMETEELDVIRNLTQIYGQPDRLDLSTHTVIMSLEEHGGDMDMLARRPWSFLIY